MSTHLFERVRSIVGVEVLGAPEANALFVRLPIDRIAELQAWSFFWEWDAATTEVRWMTSFDSTADDIEIFADGVALLVDEHPASDQASSMRSSDSMAEARNRSATGHQRAEQASAPR
jgi:hypothetical protein